MNTLRLTVLALSFALSSAHAQTTGVTGGGVPFDNMQPSLVVTEMVPLSGIYPSRDSGFAMGDTLGFVYSFAGNYNVRGTANAAGQLLPISSNTAVFSLLGTNYGGDGRVTFGLPNLSGKAVIGTGTGPGLTPRTEGETTGTRTVTLTSGELPSHLHTFSGGVTGVTGGNLPFDNMQPSLAMHRVIATAGVYPGRDGSSGAASFLGQVATFAGNFAPGGWMEADGRLLSIASNTALFSILGTTYGGDGRTTFALPDLRGRVSIGADETHALGMSVGQESTTLLASQMPAHTHTVPGGSTNPTGGGLPVDNMQPSLALNYLIALEGIFPSRDGGGLSEDIPFIGQISEFAGNFAPGGWAFANGDLLPIAGNEALFAVIGTTYGGDGVTTFALPDFGGRTMLGAGGEFDVGEVFGRETNVLSVANLAPHLHSLPPTTGGPTGDLPEPASGVLVFAALAALAYSRRQRQA